MRLVLKMDQHLIRQKLESLSYLEMANSKDHFLEVSVWANEYKTLYGCDNWINNFISEYLDQRREYGRA